jgi:biopolymer transport protein ExbD
MSNYVPLTPIGGPAGQPFPPQQSFPPPPQKKSNVRVWLLAGCGTFVVIWVIAGFLGGYYARKAWKEAGLDPELMQKSPALAVAKKMVEDNPDVFELVSVDDEKRLITIRNKQTGETRTLNMDAKDVSWIYAIPADGEYYSGRDKLALADLPTWVRSILKDKPGEIVYIKSGKKVKYGTVVSVKDSIRDAGFSVKLPDWFPSYPGAVVQGAFSTESKDGERAYFGFSTNDSIEKVVKFYEEHLKQAGLKVTTDTVQQNGVVSKGSLASEDRDKKRTAFVTAISEKGQTQVTVVFASK